MPFADKVVLGVLVTLVAACTPSVTPTPTPLLTSSWGRIIVIGQAEQSQAPALWLQSQRIVTIWVGADEAGVHHDARVLSQAGLLERVTLPLPPVRPYAQRLIPAADNALHLLWLDAGETGETRLFSALLTPTLDVERGPTPVSDQRTLRYAAIATAHCGWGGVGESSLSRVSMLSILTALVGLAHRSILLAMRIGRLSPEALMAFSIYSG
jgi:hypothetical protein